MSNNNKQGQYHLQEKREREQKAQEAIALVRAQEREKERKYVMRWERDPEDRTLWRWVKVRPKTTNSATPKKRGRPKKSLQA